MHVPVVFSFKPTLRATASVERAMSSLKSCSADRGAPLEEGATSAWPLLLLLLLLLPKAPDGAMPL